MARTPRTVELASISLRCPQEVRGWLEQRMKDTGRKSLNEAVNDLIDKLPDLREYIVSLLLERYVSLRKTS